MTTTWLSLGTATCYGAGQNAHLVVTRALSVCQFAVLEIANSTVADVVVDLVAVTGEHYSFVYNLFLEDPSCFQWLFPFGIPERDAFIERVSQAVSNFQIVVEGKGGRPIGIAYLHQWRPQDGVAYFHVSLAPTASNDDMQNKAMNSFVSAVFRTLNIRKLYMNIDEWRFYAIARSLSGKYEHEGRLKDHSYYDGRLHDRLIVSVNRDRWCSGEGGAEMSSISHESIEADPAPSPAENGSPNGPAEVGPDPRWLPLGRDTRNLVSARVRLDSVQAGHMEYLHRLAASDDVGLRWRFGGVAPTIREFQRSLHHGVFAQFVPVLRHSGQPFGHVLAYQMDPLNGHVHIGGVTEARLHRTGYPMEAFVIFLRYLFTNWNFRKIYMDLPEYNRPQVFAAGLIDGIEEEARLRDVTYFDGSWWDWSIVSISRNFFRECLGL